MAGGSNPPSATSPIPLDRLADIMAGAFGRLRVAQDARLVLAVSGGPDSMALLHGCARAVAEHRGDWRLTVAHLDHSLRAESADDATFVGTAAADLGVWCEIRRVDVAARARDQHLSTEEAGRNARYEFLEEVAPPGAFIATAHTADDSAETVLLNLLRGSGTSGARGIPERRGRVIRPLLRIPRDELRLMLDEAGLGFRLDASNDDPTHLRNRIRHELLPMLESLRPGAVSAVNRFARLAGEDDALLDALAAGELGRRRDPSGQLDWREPPARALGRRIVRLAVGRPWPPSDRIDAVLDAAEGDRGGVVIELGGGREAAVRERRIALR